MRIFNILSALASRKNNYYVQNKSTPAPTTAGSFEVARITVTEPGTYLAFLIVESNISAADILIIGSILSEGTALTERYTCRTSMNSGGGVCINRLLQCAAGDAIIAQSYSNGVTRWTARASLCAIKLVGGVISTLRRAVII